MVEMHWGAASGVAGGELQLCGAERREGLGEVLRQTEAIP
eukprot:CAMPEP_0117618130 /NCGR_PEP_ID=MMETSP0784-20121206/85942_1 /TAXON_ID=39447 /ORGANISM="" /LENGTH=39 /DNA_ID= /DNA_START= /DNA_END= /DNA_ORIENTATION=